MNSTLAKAVGSLTLLASGVGALIWVKSLDERWHVGMLVPDSFDLLSVPGLIALGVVAFIVWFLLGGKIESPSENLLREAQLSVAAAATRQYAIAKRSGAAIDAYVQAGLASMAYLQAEDEQNYSAWKIIEANEAVLAGVIAPH